MNVLIIIVTFTILIITTRVIPEVINCFFFGEATNLTVTIMGVQFVRIHNFLLFYFIVH